MNTTDELIKGGIALLDTESPEATVAAIMYDVAKQEMETNTVYSLYLSRLRALESSDVVEYAISQLTEIMGNEDNHATRAKRAGDFAAGVKESAE